MSAMPPTMTPLFPHEDQGVPFPAQGQQKRSTAWPILLVAVLAAMVLSSGVTYAGVVNNWLPALTGVMYPESEHLAEVESAYAEGEDSGFNNGYDQGFSEGDGEGFAAGYDRGFDDGYELGADDGLDVGLRTGEDSGWDAGWSDGYDVGWTDGCLALFDALGTDRVGDWWDYYHGPAWAEYYTNGSCD